MSSDVLLENGLHVVGHTPLMMLSRLGRGLPGKIAVKMDYMNPTGSVKDRTAAAMIEEAEKTDKISPEKTVLIEATSGNMGIALARCAAIRGYKCILCMPSNVSVERRALLKAFGAELILTDPCLGFKGMSERAQLLVESIPGGYTLNQFSNPANPLAHYKTTGPEIWRQSNEKVDIVCFGVGTGGTLTGVGRYLKEKNSNIKVYAVEPDESAVINGQPSGQHKIQGIGIGIIPPNLDRSLLSGCLRVHSRSAVEMARRLAREEGLLCGITSGANVCAAMALAAHSGNSGKLIVTSINDFGERYLSTELYSDIQKETALLRATTTEEAIGIAKKYLARNGKRDPAVA